MLVHYLLAKQQNIFKAAQSAAEVLEQPAVVVEARNNFKD